VQGLHLVSDPGLDRGDAVLDVPDGIVDARISTALARAKAVLVGGQQ
jgi:flagellar assembly protein FliH